MSQAQKPKYKHAEAFALMWYACEACSHRERIWNSRDGITPFGTTCPSCGDHMSHTDWHSDIDVPHHKLRVGQRFWRDGTPAEAVAIMERRLKSHSVGALKRKNLLEWAGSKDPEGEFRKGWPILDIFERKS
jgi:hypothetical protein